MVSAHDKVPIEADAAAPRGMSDQPDNRRIRFEASLPPADEAVLSKMHQTGRPAAASARRAFAI